MTKSKKRTSAQMLADNLKKRNEIEETRKAKELKQLTQELEKSKKVEKSLSPGKAEKKILEEKEALRRAENKKLRDDKRAGFLTGKYGRVNNKKKIKNKLKKDRKKRLKKEPDLFESAFDAAHVFTDIEFWLKKYENYKCKQGEPICPYCKIETKVYKYECRGIFKCKECQRQFNIKTGSIFHNSKISFDKWMFLLLQETISERGLTCKDVKNQIGVSIKTGHSIINKIRSTAFNQDIFKFNANRTIAIDTSAVFGSNVNRTDYNKLTKAEIYKKSLQVLGMKQEDGNVIALLVNDLKEKTMLTTIKEHIPKGVMIYSDEHKSFANIAKHGYSHETTNHSKGEHSRGIITTNGIESFNSQLKTGLKTHNNCFTKGYLQNFVNSIVFTANTNKALLTMNEKFSKALENIANHNEPQKQIAKVKKIVQKKSSIVPQTKKKIRVKVITIAA